VSFRMVDAQHVNRSASDQSNTSIDLLQINQMRQDSTHPRMRERAGTRHTRKRVWTPKPDFHEPPFFRNCAL